MRAAEKGICAVNNTHRPLRSGGTISAVPRFPTAQTDVIPLLNKSRFVGIGRCHDAVPRRTQILGIFGPRNDWSEEIRERTHTLAGHARMPGVCVRSAGTGRVPQSEFTLSCVLAMIGCRSVAPARVAARRASRRNCIIGLLVTAIDTADFVKIRSWTVDLSNWLGYEHRVREEETRICWAVSFTTLQKFRMYTGVGGIKGRPFER